MTTVCATTLSAEAVVVEAYRLGRYDNVVGDGFSNAGKVVEAYLWKAMK